MKAVRIHEYGGTNVLRYEDGYIPMIGPEDVLIRVHAAGVNPVDAVLRAGYMSEYVSVQLPYILGIDVSGVVEQAGSAVTDLKPGDEVYARANLARDGAYAEYIAVQACDVALKPKSFDHIHAAATPHAALSAWQCLFEACNLTAGQTVLVHAAAGGVGHFAVQFAKRNGARVIGNCSEGNVDFVRGLGADEVIDYGKTAFESAVRDVDLVVDLVGGETQQRSWGTIKQGGALVSLVQPPSHELASQHGVTPHFLAIHAHKEQLEEVARAIDAGHIQCVVSHVFPLQEAAKAHELIQTRHTRGKIVLQVAE